MMTDCFRRTPFAQKWIIVPLLYLVQFCPTAIRAQQVSLHVKNDKISKILEDIKKQTDYSFFYNRSIGLDKVQRSIDVKDQPLTSVLDQLFTGLPFTYEIANKTIVIRPAITPKNTGPPGTRDLPMPGAQSIIKGKVTDEDGNPIEGIRVEEAATRIFTYTDDHGEFSLASGEKGTLLFVSKGAYLQKEVPYARSSYIIAGLEPMPSIVTMDSAMVLSYKSKKDPTQFIDLNNREYMNLGQVLQGTIPGLSLQILSTSQKQVNSIDVYTHYQNGTTQNVDVYTAMSVEEFLNYKGAIAGQAIINTLLQNPNAYSSGGFPLYRLHTSMIITNTLVPQIRGANSFSGSSSSMLIVIDGFPQDNFPADYPMSNVESVEVIKDPKELLKWGARAAGGVIFIKTKMGRKGALKVGYTSNYYYSPAPGFDRNKLQLASSADYLDYLQDLDLTYSATSFNLTPAQRLLSEKSKNLITTAQFDKSWDSLKTIDNENQIRWMQQNAFSQNQTLSLVGGSYIYKFAIIGNYFSTQGNELNSTGKATGLNLNNHFNLLDSKLRIDWLIKYNWWKNRTGYSFDPTTLEPYQLLLDQDKNYLYDYKDLSPSANTLIESYGYKNYGVNILEDARLNRSTSKKTTIQTRYDMSWDLLPGIKWLTSIYYNGQNGTTENLYDKRSSYVRQLVDRYGQIESNGVNFYVPYGDIMNRSKQQTRNWNVRSGLSFSKSKGGSQFTASLGGGAASNSYNQPASATIYAYNRNTGTGAPIYLPTPDPHASISNFYKLLSASSVAFPYTLMIPAGGDSTRSRNLNWNAALGYQYNDHLYVSGAINNVYNPLYGQQSTWSVLSNYNLDATALLIKNTAKHAVFNKLSFSSGLQGMKMPDLPVVYGNTRYQQINWNDYAIWVNGLSPTQQKGQRTLNIYQKLILNMFDDHYKLYAAYNELRIKGSTASFSNTASNTDTNYLQRYISAGMQAGLRKDALKLNINYSRSPEGQDQVNAVARYDMMHETWFHAKNISTFKLDGLIENISSYQALGLMMGTNVAAGGLYNAATNYDFTQLPPTNRNWEVHFTLGMTNDVHLIDLRYYNHVTSGLNNNVSVYTDPSTGLSSQVTYSSINNKGIEFFFKNDLVKKKRFSYVITLNGAYNVNKAKSVPVTAFSATNNYPTAYRNGYNTSNIWSFKWAGLNDQGEPQVYDAKGKITASLDSATLSSAMVFSGVTTAPWTGGLIHEITYKQFFARAALTFQWGYVMKRYMPVLNTDAEQSALIKYRWRQAGDEKKTDIARISTDAGNTWRSFVIQNASNSILPADNIRLQEIMIGWNAPATALQRLGLSAFTIAFQIQNAAVWTRNKLHLDPSSVGANGQVGTAVPRQYSCTVSAGF